MLSVLSVLRVLRVPVCLVCQYARSKVCQTCQGSCEDAGFSHVLQDDERILVCHVLGWSVPRMLSVPSVLRVPSVPVCLVCQK